MSALQTALIIVLFLPMFFSGLLYVSRLAASCINASKGIDERTEQAFLIAMLAPSLIGALLLMIAPELTVAPPPFIADTVSNALHISDVSIVAADVVSDAGIFSLVMGGIGIFYGLGATIRMGQIWFSRWSLDRVLKHAMHAPDIDAQAFVIEQPISPFASLCGKIVIPNGLIKKLSSSQLTFVLAHEKAHLARKDPVYFLVLAVVDAILWPNVFLRRQTARCRLAAELSCDHIAMSGNMRERRLYADTLLLAVKYVNAPSMMSAPAIFSPRHKGDYAMRIANIMNTKGKRASRSGIKGYVALATSVFTLTAVQWAYADGLSGAPDFSARPMEGRLSSSFGVRNDPFSKQERMHHGADIAAPLGASIVAAASGEVTRAETLDGFGKLIEIAHSGGYVTRYANLGELIVAKGDKVSAGDTIARNGVSGRSTGPHLHVEVIKDGERIDPATVLDLPEKRKKASAE